MRKILMMLLWMLVPVAGLCTSPKLELLETFPAGSQVTISTDANFYLRIAYQTDTPIQVWVQPYFEGKPVRAGTSPSRRHDGKGELLAWFFLMPPGGQVDEIRVTAGDGSHAGTHEVARWPVRLFAYPNAQSPRDPPVWVTDLRASDETAARQAMQKHVETPAPASVVILSQLLPWLLLALLSVGTALSLWGMIRWRGYWRVLATLPLLAMGFVLLRIVVDTMIDGTSHNLWPLELVMAGIGGSLLMLVVSVVRLVVRKRQRNAQTH